MIFLMALVAGAAGAALGGGAGMLLLGILGAASGGARGDIGSAFFLVAFIIPVGIPAGLAAGVVLALRRRGIRSRAQTWGYLGAVAATIAGISGAGLAAYIFTIDDIINPNGPTPLLAFEVRLPASAPLPARGGIELRTDKNRMPGSWKPQSVRQDGDRTVFAGEVEI